MVGIDGISTLDCGLNCLHSSTHLFTSFKIRDIGTYHSSPNLIAYDPTELSRSIRVSYILKSGNDSLDSMIDWVWSGD